MLLTDIRELKTLLDIDVNNSAEDKKLNFLAEMASQWIEEVLGRPDLSFKSRTEYYNGSGTQKLLLRSRPVFTTPTITVSEDSAGAFASASGSFGSETALTYGTDFCLWTEPGESGKSRSGILIRLNDVWDRPTNRQRGLLAPFLGEAFGTIKVVYTGGNTVDDLPPVFRLACNTVVARLRHLFPIGFLTNSESYEDRSISVSFPEKDQILSIIKGMLWSYRNWRF